MRIIGSFILPNYILTTSQNGWGNGYVVISRNVPYFGNPCWWDHPESKPPFEFEREIDFSEPFSSFLHLYKRAESKLKEKHKIYLNEELWKDCWVFGWSSTHSGDHTVTKKETWSITHRLQNFFLNEYQKSLPPKPIEKYFDKSRELGYDHFDSYLEENKTQKIKKYYSGWEGDVWIWVLPNGDKVGTNHGGYYVISDVEWKSYQREMAQYGNFIQTIP